MAERDTSGKVNRAIVGKPEEDRKTCKNHMERLVRLSVWLVKYRTMVMYDGAKV